MSGLLKFVLIVSGVFLIIDLYVYQAFRVSFKKNKYKWWLPLIFWGVSFLSIISFFSLLLTDYHYWPKTLKIFLLGSIFVIYISKLFVIHFLFLDDIIRLLTLMYHLIANLTGKFIPSQKHKKAKNLLSLPAISRQKFLNQAGLIVGLLPFSTFLYGMLRGAYDYRVHHHRLVLPQLPPSFDGLRVVQISDLHVGSFLSENPLKKVVKMINAQRADIVVFTGDLVNNLATEMNGFESILSGIKADYGVYSILGNHDYGEYVQWENEELKKENFKGIVGAHERMGWNLLRNDHVILKKDKDNIALIGVENWSAFGNLTKYGNIQKAIKGTENIPCKLLLTHDPTHWEKEILVNYSDINFTFAGHTHGLQVGVDLPGFKWSPVQYFYKYWHGLYKEKDQYLYVNRGIGFTGYPGRVGMYPEVTVFDFSRA